jgi:hypothetical protein
MSLRLGVQVAVIFSCCLKVSRDLAWQHFQFFDTLDVTASQQYHLLRILLLCPEVAYFLSGQAWEVCLLATRPIKCKLP